MSRKFAVIVTLLLLGMVLTVFILVKNKQNQDLVKNRTPEQTEPQSVSDKWYIYASPLRYKISYPENYVIDPNGEHSILIFKPADEPGAGPTNFIYVSVVQPNMLDNEGEIYNYRPTWFDKLNNIQIGDSVSLADSEQPIFDQVMTYTRLGDAQIDGHTAKRFENKQPWEFPTGTTEVRYIFELDGYIYILGYYYGGKEVVNPIDPREAYNIVSSFRLVKSFKEE